MGGYEAQSRLTRTDISRGANIQQCAVGGGEWAVDHVADAVWGLFGVDDVVVLRVVPQCLGELFPVLHDEAVPQKKFGLAATNRMGRIEKVMGDLPLGDRG